jgi:hypothetical protein
VVHDVARSRQNAVLTTTTEERESTLSKQIPEVEIRFFSSGRHRRPEVSDASFDSKPLQEEVAVKLNCWRLQAAIE